MILLTGLTGKSGGGLIEAMQRRSFKEKIRVVVRENSNLEKLQNSDLNYDLCYGDVADEEFMRTVAEGCDIVFHIASKGLIGKVAKAVSQVDTVKHCFMVSSTSIYSRYRMASDKLIAAENEMKSVFATRSESRGGYISYTIIRPTMVYGTLNDSNISTFMKWLDKYPIFPIIKNGKALLQPVYKDDLGEAYYLLLENADHVKNQEFIVSGDKPITLKEVLTTISNSIGKKTKFINVPMPVANTMVKTAYALYKIDYREQLFRLTENRAFDHTEMTQRFGYKPRDFFTGIKKLAKEYVKIKQENSKH